MKTLRPDYFFRHYTELTPEWLKKKKFKTILSDLDGTLAPHGEMGDEQFEKWARTLEKEEITLIIVSNNDSKRIEPFLRKYQLVGYAKCGKPQTKVIEESLFQKGLNPSTTLFLGDQIFTDMWCGKNLGIKTALVKPIEGNDPINIQAKRVLERMLLKKWRKKP